MRWQGLGALGSVARRCSSVPATDIDVFYDEVWGSLRTGSEINLGDLFSFARGHIGPLDQIALRSDAEASANGRAQDCAAVLFLGLLCCKHSIAGDRQVTSRGGRV